MKNILSDKINRNLIIFVLITCLLFMLLVIFLFIPVYYDLLFGNKIIKEHLQEVVGQETDPNIIALSLMDWHHKNVIYPLPEENIFVGGGVGFYEIKNETRLFLRNGPASWTIKTQLARCGESARYFVEIMEELGFKARMIQPQGKNPWDHAWAEYYDLNGNKIVVDPSSNKVISPNLHGWAENATFDYIQAIDLKGNKEDITKEYR